MLKRERRRPKSTNGRVRVSPPETPIKGLWVFAPHADLLELISCSFPAPPAPGTHTGSVAPGSATVARLAPLTPPPQESPGATLGGLRFLSAVTALEEQQQGPGDHTQLADPPSWKGRWPCLDKLASMPPCRPQSCPQGPCPHCHPTDLATALW